MSRYGAALYGKDYYGEVVNNAFDATPFTAVATSYSTVEVNWRVPGGSWTKQRLIRNSNGTPVSVDDGVTLLTEAFAIGATNTHVVGDTALTSGRFYYYALFVLDTRGIWRLAGADEVLVPKDFGYTDRLFNRLPEIFKTADTEQLGSGALATTSSFLYRFLSVFGNEFDFLRTEYEALRHALDARTISMTLLPALSRQVGMSFEPQLGARAQRRLVANAVHLYGIRGTLPGTRELASTVTGWDCSVRVGYNLALDDLDAGPKGSEGRWHGVDGSAKVTYAARRNNAALPIDLPGYLDITATGGRVDAIIDMDHSVSGDNYGALQYAIPIVQGRTYTTSQYVAGPRDDSSLAARIRITWLDVKGRSLGYDTDGADQILSNIYTARPYLTLTAPLGARYLKAALVITAQSGFIAAHEKLRAVGFMVDESNALRPWQCAREIIVQLRAELINEMVYPQPAPDDTVSRWTSNAGDDTTDGTVFTSTATSSHSNIDAFPGTYRIVNKAGTGYSLSAEVHVATARTARFVMVAYDNNGTSTVHTTSAINVDPATTAVTAQIPPDMFGDNIVIIAFGLRFEGGFGVGDAVSYTRIGVFRSNVAVDYFDGATASQTFDNIWEGLQYASRSYHYTQRVVRTQRLRALLRDFLPTGSCFSLEFAQPVSALYASPAAVEGLDVNTGEPPPPPPVGRSLELLWNVEGNNTNSLGLIWNVESLMVHSDLALEWDTAKKVTADLVLPWNDIDLSGTAGANLDLLWNQLQLTSFGAAPASDTVSGGWSNAPSSTNGWTLNNVSDSNYVYSGTGPVHQTGMYVEIGTDGITRTGSFAIPNVGDTLTLLVQAPGGLRTAVRDVVFYGIFGEQIYHWYNRSADFSTRTDLRLKWNVLAGPHADLSLLWRDLHTVHQDHSEVWNINDTGYAGGYAGGY
jgi:phage tail-like protein